jgi:hypothetical protein
MIYTACFFSVAIAVAIGLLIGWQWGYACGKNEASQCK